MGEREAPMGVAPMGRLDGPVRGEKKARSTAPR